MIEPRIAVNNNWVLTEFNKEQLTPLLNKVDYIKQNFVSSPKYNHELAGNIEHEYEIEGMSDYITKLFNPAIRAHADNFPHLHQDMAVVLGKYQVILDRAWVNFQKKYEFNPVHRHSGIYSYVIWLDIPYSIEDEMARASSKDSNKNIPGHFQFLLNEQNGITSINLPVDKTWNYKAVLFPSWMNHCVYPFYTSDEYRVSVSGNFKYKIVT